MQLTIIQNFSNQFVDEFLEKMSTINLVYYASDAAAEMGFDNIDEMTIAVKRALNICVSARIPMKGNFQRIYKSSSNGIVSDWMLSLLAYKLVCLSGKSSNPNVARLTIQLLKSEPLNYF